MFMALVQPEMVAHSIKLFRKKHEKKSLAAVAEVLDKALMEMNGYESVKMNDFTFTDNFDKIVDACRCLIETNYQRVDFKAKGKPPDVNKLIDNLLKKFEITFRTLSNYFMSKMSIDQRYKQYEHGMSVLFAAYVKANGDIYHLYVMPMPILFYFSLTVFLIMQAKADKIDWQRVEVMAGSNKNAAEVMQQVETAKDIMFERKKQLNPEVDQRFLF